MREGEQGYAEFPCRPLHSSGYRSRAQGRSTRADGNGCKLEWRRRFALFDAEIGDAGFVASGPTVETLFCNASEELLAMTVERADLIRDQVACNVTLAETELDLLLTRYLNGLVYLRETGLLLLRSHDVYLDFSERIRLRSHLGGEIFDPGRHKLIREVTRVATHPLRVLHDKKFWEVLVTLKVRSPPSIV